MLVKIPIKIGDKIVFQSKELTIIPKSEKTLIVKFPYHPEIIKIVKLFEGARWHPDEKVWTIKNNSANHYRLDRLQGIKDERYNQKIIDKWSHFFPELMEHQKEGVGFILTRFCCVLAFEMGLGKTLTTLRAFTLVKALNPSFTWWLVAPPGAQKEWERQIDKWHSLTAPSVVSTYESLHKPMARYSEPPDGVVFDESIKIKNPNAQRSKVSGELCRLIRERLPDAFIILLSGAPAPQEPSDWWHQIEVCQPGFLCEGSINKFRNNLAVIEYEDHGYGLHPVLKEWKEDEIQKLGERLAPIVLRKERKDCLDLPPKIYDTITCEPSEELKRVAATIPQIAESGIMALTLLRELSDGFQYTGHGEDCPEEAFQWLGSPKIKVIDQLLDFYALENGGPGRLVIYAAFHASIDYLYEHIQESTKTNKCKWQVLKIDGRGWSDSNALELFETSESNLCLVANPKCVHGLNLQQTQALVYYSNDFSVDARIQSEDRRDRPGMDTSRGTRVVDIVNLSTDELIIERLKQGKELQAITMEEIKRCLEAG